jgi:hypothetical protein
MPEDPVVAEVRKARKRLAEKCGRDLGKIVAYVRKCEAKSNHELVDLSHKRSRAHPA